MKNEQKTDEIINRLGNGQPVTPDELHLLARHDNQDVRDSVARHPQCPPETLQLLANDPAWSVVMSVAGNTACPHDLLADLARHNEWAVRLQVAGNDTTQPELLLTLAGNAEEEGEIDVLCKIMGHPACPEILFWDAFHSGDAEVMKYAVDNPICPLAVTLQACDDNDTDLQWAAKKAIADTKREIWATRVAAGIRLGLPVRECRSKSTLGDDLLKHGFVQAYQIIQGLELEASIKPLLTADTALATSLVPTRMRM
ncbi:hypothetical protein V0242_25245 (plasmid) [Aeromonas hydrophila]|uniref:hypothetical protein n=1 Tax=Aeromonas hydrophila TaxID=644 RepID=UPI002ECFBE6A|nr:hypothetical protein V0242_25245 [Aeromonas hydrophila]